MAVGERVADRRQCEVRLRLEVVVNWRLRWLLRIWMFACSERVVHWFCERERERDRRRGGCGREIRCNRKSKR